MKSPKVIFLDAVGTLFGIRGTVGEIYSAIAAKTGVIVSPESLNVAFLKSFKTSPPLAFAEAELDQIPELEFQWWQAIAENAFTEVGATAQFSDFSAFFNQLYGHFATGDPWYLYPDVLPTLTAWQTQRIELGIISNFDSRIYNVLEVLKIRHFFRSITISSFTGSAKPDRTIFAAALEKHDCFPRQAWHIGDSLQEDYYAAKALGMKPFLIERRNS